jgi:phage terminase large subunit GpA-like protein
MVAQLQSLPNPFESRTFAPSLARLLRTCARAWQPYTPPPTVEWVERELHLPPDTSANPGPIDLVSRPYWREPLALMDDPDVRTITMMGDAQGGKTVTLMAMLLSRAICDPAPCMIAGPDQDAMRELRDKLYGMAEVSPALAGKIPPVSKRNDRWLDFSSMICYLAYSGSKQRLRGRACKFVFATECDVWQDDPRLGSSAKLIQARVKAFVEHKIVYESTPSDDLSTIALLYGRSDQRKFWVPCFRCNHWQELRFFPHTKGKLAGRGGVAGLQAKDGTWLRPEDVRGVAYYVGECGCRIDSADKNGMVENGLWVPRGCKVKRDRVVGEPARSVRNAGYHMSALYAAHLTFGDIAEQYLEARESNSLRVFWNNWLGLPDKLASKLPGWKTLGQRLAWSHRRGTVPADAYFLTSQADVQSDRCYAGVRAWGDKRASWLVDFFEFPLEPAPKTADTKVPIASDLARLESDVLAVLFPVNGTNPLGYSELPVRLLGVDTNYRNVEVHDFVKFAQTLYGDRIRATRGDHKVDPIELYKKSVVERNSRTGKVYEGGLELWGISINVFREMLLSLFSYPADQVGAWLLTGDVLAWGGNYLRQLVNQGPRTEVLPNGKQITKWVTRDKGVGEHSWDIEVVQLALAHMVTGGEWDARAWHPTSAQPVPAALSETISMPRGMADDDFSAR